MSVEQSAALAAWATIIVALVAVWFQNASAKELTCLQLFVSLAERYDSQDMQICRSALAKKLLDSPTTLDVDDRLLVFYESIAILNRKKVLDQELLSTTFSVDVCGYWHALKHYIEHARTTFHDLTIFAELEALKDRFEQEIGSDGLIGIRDKVPEFLAMERRRAAAYNCND